MESLTEEELAKIKRFSEADLPHALQNEEGAARRALAMPDEQPPEDYKGEDFQLDRAKQMLKDGTITASTGLKRAG